MIHEIAAIARVTGLAVAAVLVYAGSLYKYPWRPCAWCKGSGLSRGSSKGRHGRCWRCKGTKQVQRLGSRSVHRLAWAIRGEVGRARARRAEQKAADRAAHPSRLADRDY